MSETWSVKNGNQLTAKTETMMKSMRTTRFRSSSRLASKPVDASSPGVVWKHKVWAIRPYATSIVSTYTMHAVATRCTQSLGPPRYGAWSHRTVQRTIDWDAKEVIELVLKR